jgi:hypothetical protein
MIARSSRPEVRNPMLALPATRRLAESLQEPARALLAEVLTELARDAADRARASWRSHKAPMACYWKIVSVYARHLARALRQAPLADPAAGPAPAAVGDRRRTA